VEGAAAKVQDKGKARRKLLARRTALAKLLEKGSSLNDPFFVGRLFLGLEGDAGGWSRKTNGGCRYDSPPGPKRESRNVNEFVNIG
jgi:hypothetical protein